MKLLRSILLALKDVFKAYMLLKDLLVDLFYSIVIILHGLKAVVFVVFGLVSLVGYVVLFPVIVYRKMRILK